MTISNSSPGKGKFLSCFLYVLLRYFSGTRITMQIMLTTRDDKRVSLRCRKILYHVSNNPPISIFLGTCTLVRPSITRIWEVRTQKAAPVVNPYYLGEFQIKLFFNLYRIIFKSCRDLGCFENHTIIKWLKSGLKSQQITFCFDAT